MHKRYELLFKFIIQHLWRNERTVGGNINELKKKLLTDRVSLIKEGQTSAFVGSR